MLLVSNDLAKAKDEDLSGKFEDLGDKIEDVNRLTEELLEHLTSRHN